MTQDDPYEDWRQARRNEFPPDGFTERVMAAILECLPAQVGASRRTSSMTGFSNRRGAVLVVAAGAAFAFRLAAAIAVFFAAS